MLSDRRLIVGGAAGLLAGMAHVGLLLALSGSAGGARLGPLDQPGRALAIHALASVAIGISYAWLWGSARGGYAEKLVSGMVHGFSWWILLSLNLQPILMGQGPQWSADAVAPALPGLLGYLFQGGALALGYAFLIHPALGWLPRVDALAPGPRVARHHIVILGGGFAGVTTAQQLERLFIRDESVRISLISDANYFLFTPMLAEVTASGIEASHISTPLRAFFRTVEVIYGEIDSVDLNAQLVGLAPRGASARPNVTFDYLVLALGGTPDFYNLPGLEAQAYTFKSMEDAVLLRDHVIEMLERADGERNAETRKAELTFVVAGGGFAGAELIGELNDFVRGSLGYYPDILSEEVSLILVHSGPRILPELTPELADYAREKLQARGVTFRLQTRVGSADPGVVTLSSGEAIKTETLVWTAGNSPNPLLRRLGVGLDTRGAVRTDAHLAVMGHLGLWAVGDCAAVPDARTGQPYPPTAQFAVREAAAAARNIHAVIRGRAPQPFSCRAPGSFVLLGHEMACAEIGGWRFSGLLAWVLWRAVYLNKLPTLEKKIRVALDWTVDLFFPRDIVHSRAPRSATGRADSDAAAVTGPSTATGR